MALVKDTFTGTAGQSLQTHTPDISSGAWEALGFDINGVTNLDNAVLSTPGGGSLIAIGGFHSRAYRQESVPAYADYDVYCQFILEDSTLMVSGVDGIAIYARMTPTGTSGASVNRYEARITWLGGIWVCYLNKWVGGAKTELGVNTGFASMSGWLKLKVVGTTISLWTAPQSGSHTPGTWTQRISVTDSSITQVGRVGLCAGPDHGAGATKNCRIDDFWGDGSFQVKTGSDTSALTITESATKLVTVLKTGSDSAALTITESNTKDVLVLKTASDSAALTVSEGTPAKETRSSMGIRVGLVTDIEPYLLITNWEASEWFAMAQLLIPKAAGTVLDWVYDAGSGVIGLDVTALPSTAFDSLLASHPGSMFVSGVDQSGSMRLFAVAQLIEGDPAPIRASIALPYSTLPLTQDPAAHAGALEGAYARLPLGMFSWPPVMGGANKYQAGHVAQGMAVSDPLELALLRLDAIWEPDEATPVAPHIRISAIDMLPITDGHFAMLPNRLSEQSSLQQGEILVMDSIDPAGGGYVVKPTEKPATLQENIHMPSTSLAAILGGGIYLRPAASNCMVFMGDGWTALDDLGGAASSTAFNAWIEYEPRYLYV